MPKGWLAELLLVLAGALAAVNLFGTASFRVAAFDFQVETKLLARPETRIVLPPVGEVAAATHRSPVLFRLTLTNIDPDGLAALLRAGQEQGNGNLLVALREEGKAHLWPYGLRLVLLAALGGAGGVFCLHRRGWRPYLRAACLGVSLLGGILGLAYATFNPAAFANPQYQGALRHAPWIMALAQEAVTDVSLLGKQMRVVSENFSALSQRLRQLDPGTNLEDTLRILHVSDIHNNPAAYELIAKTAASFQVQAVIDTGDITDYGTPLEGQLFTRLRRLGLPYYFVPGNHDSPATLAALAKVEGVKVISAGMVTIRGLRLLAMEDPAAATPEIAVPGPEVMAQAAARLEALLAFQKEPPDLVAVHNPDLARQIVGKVPVILAGHTHRYGLEIKEGTVLINAGSTGAAGLRGLVGKGDVPYSLAVLYWRREGGSWHLVGVDLIRVPGGENGFVLERRIFPAAAAKPAA